MHTSYYLKIRAPILADSLFN
eukprot:UN20223